MATLPGQYEYDHASPPERSDDSLENAEIAIEWATKEAMRDGRRVDFDGSPLDNTIEVRLLLPIVADGTEAEQLADHLKAMLASVERKQS